jgi:hypothetical protein
MTFFILFSAAFMYSKCLRSADVFILLKNRALAVQALVNNILGQHSNAYKRSQLSAIALLDGFCTGLLSRPSDHSYYRNAMTYMGHSSCESSSLLLLPLAFKTLASGDFTCLHVFDDDTLTKMFKRPIAELLRVPRGVQNAALDLMGAHSLEYTFCFRACGDVLIEDDSDEEMQEVADRPLNLTLEELDDIQTGGNFNIVYNAFVDRGIVETSVKRLLMCWVADLASADYIMKHLNNSPNIELGVYNFFATGNPDKHAIFKVNLLIISIYLLLFLFSYFHIIFLGKSYLGDSKKRHSGISHAERF